jgi:hypothetical protein
VRVSSAFGLAVRPHALSLAPYYYASDVFPANNSSKCIHNDVGFGR